MIVPDVNLLLYAYFEEFPQHRAARQWWEDTVNGIEPVGLPWSVIIGFVRVATRRKELSNPITALQAMAIVDGWLAHTHIAPLHPQSRHRSILATLATTTTVEDNLVPDAHIAAIAIEHNAEVHTNDRDFRRFPGLRWRNPLAATA